MSSTNDERVGAASNAQATTAELDSSEALKAPGIRLGLRVLRTGPAVILIVLVIIMSFLNEYFLTVRNLQNLLTQTTMIATLALGQLLVIIVRGVDVSVGSVLGLTVVLSGLMMDSGIDNGFIHVIVFLSAGAVFGLFNGFMIVKGGIPQPLIVTVATLGIGRGMALLLSGGTEHIGMAPLVQAAGNGSIGGIPIPAILVAFVTLMLAVLTLRTLWGRWIYAVGGNPDVAGWLGVPRDRVVMSCYMLSGVTAGIAGLIYAGRTDAASPLAGVGMELDAVTAVIIGGASLFGGRGHIVNALIGALIIGVIRNGLNLMSVSPFWEAIAIGVSILLALELDVLRRYFEEKLRARAARAMR
ncbi:ABC transporter permease [Rhizobium sp. NLR17b]|uniref:ABC transporter permease n=1 Tax=Rhizobium sp. NLR17b TaxID=2731114 RepID=UPI001C82E701|nr:ABC transporter permease [Rhizobium sp. NLR17b]MBX5272685.1 ABC transporter permease [Rhizobium sp. NLR17b]